MGLHKRGKYRKVPRKGGNASKANGSKRVGLTERCGSDMARQGGTFRHFSYPRVNDNTGQFRLLEILGREERSGKLMCHLFVRDSGRQQGVQYDAVSYTWDQQEFMSRKEDSSCQIVLNGKPFKVRQNVHDVLESISRAPVVYDGEKGWGRQRNRPIFIDAICIDQSSVYDKNRQVALMGKIYSNATKVIIWLGEPPRSFMRRELNAMLHEGYHLSQNLLRVTEGRRGYDGPVQERSREHRRPHRSYKAIEWIASHPYWERLWIVQELLLAKDVCIRISDISIPWDIFMLEWSTVDHFRENPSLLSEGLQSILHHRRGVRESHSLSVVDAITSFGMQECFDSRDKLYGLLALLKAGTWVEPDYNKSPDEVYFDTLLLGIPEINARNEPGIASSLGHRERWDKKWRITLMRAWCAKLADCFEINVHCQEVPRRVIAITGKAVLTEQGHLPCTTFLSLGDESCGFCGRRPSFDEDEFSGALSFSLESP